TRGSPPHARRKGRSLDPPPLQLHPPVVITVRNSGAPPTREAMRPPPPPFHAPCHGGAPSGRAGMLAGMAPSRGRLWLPILPANAKVGARPCATRDGIERLPAARCSVEAVGAPARECRGPFQLVLAAISSSS